MARRPPASPEAAPLGALAERLGADLVSPDLLRLALTHRSYCAEHPGALSNERLEFLGDAVLGFVVADHLFREHPELPEGDLTRIRAEVVSSNRLAPIAAELGIGEHLYLGRGEEQSGGRNKPSLLADALEALIGAAYLSSGIGKAAELALELVAEVIVETASLPELGDAKNRLQELAARFGLPPPVYRTFESGPEHARQFAATVLVGSFQGAGEGKTKRDAERAAATDAIGRFSGSVPASGRVES